MVVPIKTIWLTIFKVVIDCQTFSEENKLRSYFKKLNNKKKSKIYLFIK